MKAFDFFSLIVRPTVEEFLSDTGDDRDRLHRRGFLAAIVLYHTADYWGLENNKKTDKELSSLRKDLIEKCSDFKIIRDVADASKHGELRPQSNIPRILSSSDKVKVTECLSSDGVSYFSYSEILMYILDDGKSRPLEGVVRSVLLMWETVLQQP